MKTASSPLEEISTLDDYEMSVTGGSWSPGSLPEIPPLPSSDEVANSMYGGSKEIFEQPPPPIPRAEVSEENEDDTPKDTPDGIPSLPESGLPEGWTMEQWAHYGQRWLDQQNDD